MVGFPKSSHIWCDHNSTAVFSTILATQSMHISTGITLYPVFMIIQPLNSLIVRVDVPNATDVFIPSYMVAIIRPLTCKQY